MPFRIDLVLGARPARPDRPRQLNQPIAVSLQVLALADHLRFFNEIQPSIVKINIPLDEMKNEE